MHIFHFDGSWQKYMSDPQIKGNLRFPVKMREPGGMSNPYSTERS